jgi:hypothetical protein
MEQGTCRLCGRNGPLFNGHVWPAWAYRMYAAQVHRGGRFLRVDEGTLDNHPERYYWFCPTCENVVLGGWDKYASQICAQIGKSPTSAVVYDERFLKFAVSIAWRTAMAELERHKEADVPEVRAACRQWKSYLLGNNRRVEPFSQHIFIIHDAKLRRHNVLGGNIFPKHGFVFTEIGPLSMFGLLGRSGLDLKEIRIWDTSMFRSEGGIIQPVREFRIGTAITMKCTQFLGEYEWAVTSRVVEAARKLGDRLL